MPGSVWLSLAVLPALVRGLKTLCDGSCNMGRVSAVEERAGAS